MKRKRSGCLGCKHLWWDMGEPGYSEMTPGYSAEIICTKSVWVANHLDITQENLLTGNNCTQHEWADDLK